MMPGKTYNDVIIKAFEAFKHKPDQDWDFPEYGGNLTPAQIRSLSPEHVDAIQAVISTAQHRVATNKTVTSSWFKREVICEYEKITPPSPKARKYPRPR